MLFKWDVVVVAVVAECDAQGGETRDGHSS